MTKDKKPPETKPTVVLLIRHALNEWVEKGRLAGRLPGVHLNQRGEQQAEKLAERLATWPLRAVYSSPLERSRQTAAAIAHPHGIPVSISEGINEVDFGEWSGKELKKLAETPEWELVQAHASAMRFPGGESIREMQNRAVDEVERLAAAHKEETIALVSHADVIKCIAAHYLGMHLDLFQRLVTSPASLTVLRFTPRGARVVTLNDTSHLQDEQQPYG